MWSIWGKVSVQNLFRTIFLSAYTLVSRVSGNISPGLSFGYHTSQKVEWFSSLDLVPSQAQAPGGKMVVSVLV